MTDTVPVLTDKLRRKAEAIRRTERERDQWALELATLVASAHTAGMSVRQIATVTGYAPSWIGKLVKEHRAAS